MKYTIIDNKSNMEQPRLRQLKSRNKDFYIIIKFNRKDGKRIMKFIKVISNRLE